MKCFGCFDGGASTAGAERRSAPPTPTPTSRPVSGNGSGGIRFSDSSSTRGTSKSSASETSSRGVAALYGERGHHLRNFTFHELRQATNGFNRLTKIGEGGFGTVYKGFVRPCDDSQGDRVPVAIKKLKQESQQGHKQWLAEVQFLGIVEHPNLVKLIGFCAVDTERGIQRLLVYEFMPNKSLEEHLFNRAYPTVPWEQRLTIAIGVAEGLRYLHEGLEVEVIYRDFKAANVLLDENFNAKLSDFGLAREGPSDGNTHVSTAVVGTHGYAAPEYVETGHLTVKSDIWSFGVVLFEILTGRRSLDRNRPKPEQKLLEWVKQFPVDSKRFGMIIDPRLGHDYSISAARSISKLANACLVRNRKERPSMSEVLDSLKIAAQS